MQKRKKSLANVYLQVHYLLVTGTLLILGAKTRKQWMESVVVEKRRERPPMTRSEGKTAHVMANP